MKEKQEKIIEPITSGPLASRVTAITGEYIPNIFSKDFFAGFINIYKKVLLFR